MYPRLSDFFRDVLGFELPFPIYSYGAMVALAVLTAAWLSARELDRMYREGRLGPIQVRRESRDRRRGGATRDASPKELIGSITIVAVVMGVVGAKIFHIIERPHVFFNDPIGLIFSGGGLTFYGGFIIAGASVIWFVRSKGLTVGAVTDALAPGLMIAYGIGRIGCHLAGDGDWGIPANMAAKPDWLPTFLWAETYPNNILGEHIPEPGVYPTPIYEFAMAAVLFGVLWSLRKHPFLNGWLFSLYLVFNGAERFLIEQIRVNVEMTIFGITATQAQFISVLLFLTGVVGLVMFTRRRPGEVPREVPRSVAASSSG